MLELGLVVVVRLHLLFKAGYCLRRSNFSLLIAVGEYTEDKVQPTKNTITTLIKSVKMNQEPPQSNNLSAEEAKVQKLATEIYHLAQQNQDELLFLLSLLRNLEKVHRQIRTEMFETSLPKTRNNLYNLVKDIEEQGGWPYIERMKLQSLLKNIQSDSDRDSSVL